MITANALRALSKEQRAKEARNTLKLMEAQFAREIDVSIKGTCVETEATCEVFTRPTQKVVLAPMDTVSALFEHSQGKSTLLNFASFRHPGGGFLKGACAQEESLCHMSTLYPVLAAQLQFYEVNQCHYNGGLYADRLLYSPGIVFTDGRHIKNAGVITCAAPNVSAFRGGIERVEQAYSARLHLVLQVAEKYQTETLILGAWGCGVFGNDTYFVASAMKAAIAIEGFPKVVFAVPHGRDLNYDIFLSVLQEVLG